jgi:F0F1-type ATP synthase membrane subunit b/b'
MALTESDLTEFLRLLERDETLQLDFARAFLKERVVRKLMALDPELREAFRSAVLTEELLRLPTVVAELDQFVRQHAAETDARFDRVVQAIEGVREELRGEIQGVREELRQEFRAEIGQAREEFREGIEQAREELRGEIQGVREELRQEFRAGIGQAREEFREGIEQAREELRGEIQGVREELRQEFRAEIGQAREEFREGIEQAREELRGEIQGVREELRQEFRAEIGQAREEFRTGLQRVQAEVSGLSNWRQGETGRREGDQYEAYIVANAVTVFGDGEGGSPRRDYEVRRHLLALFRAAGVDLTTIEEADSPLVADLVWWRGNRYCVVEISVKVDDYDISRAKARAETLKLAGVEVMPVVIGSAWAYDDARAEALKAGVEWRVGKEYSQGLIEYRRSQAV